MIYFLSHIIDTQVTLKVFTEIEGIKQSLFKQFIKCNFELKVVLVVHLKIRFQVVFIFFFFFWILAKLIVHLLKMFAFEVF